MQPIKGEGTLEFEDGDIFHVYVDLRPLPGGGKTALDGIARSNEVFRIGMKTGLPVLHCGTKKIRVSIGHVSSDGTAVLRSSGSLLE
ncbi:hypothetical protein SAMN05877809_10912 [Rhodobacter sp. JA431]|uniref:hypothetical protein n=1 Tax=Rhodobacter sp. JA431 TaxID=570013 RepID=UPI000BC9C4B1|nr:hypothetical protein [Rhodobacter sp. JA431]SOC16861.1 hypothetical protein SAMN05877809_10912 [Rhodobacter sp. JA431]